MKVPPCGPVVLRVYRRFKRRSKGNFAESSWFLGGYRYGLFADGDHTMEGRG